jgi:hypothetical protein
MNHLGFAQVGKGKRGPLVAGTIILTGGRVVVTDILGFVHH